MRPLPASRVFRWLLVGAVACTTACATNVKPVADFGTAALALSSSYRPMVTGIVSACEMQRSYRMLGSPGEFDLDRIRGQAAEDCRPLREAGVTAGLFADALGGYAAALGTLAGAKPTVFEDDIGGLSGAAGRLGTRDGAPFFDKGVLDAASRLATVATELVMRQRLRRLTRDVLVESHAALRTTVEAMKTYATVIYQGQLRSTRATLDVSMKALVRASASPSGADLDARLPFRLAQVSTRADIETTEAESAKATRFGRAADALIAAHGQLIENFDRLDEADRLAAVSDFIRKVKTVREGIDAL